MLVKNNFGFLFSFYISLFYIIIIVGPYSSKNKTIDHQAMTIL